MRRLLRFAAGLAATAALAAFAQGLPAPAPLASAPPAAAPKSPPARIAEVAWLQGYWAGEGFGGEAEDVWLPPKNGVLLGAFRLWKQDGKGFYELFAIEESGESLRFVAKHFHPNWTGWEEKDKFLDLRLTEIGPGKAVFGGVSFEKTDAETLLVIVKMRKRDGASEAHRITYKRKPL